MSLPPSLFSYRKHWAARFGTAPFLPMSREEMDVLGWDSCDIILVTGDAYVDHPSFGMAVIGRILEAQGFRVGIIAQPDWHGAAPFAALGRPNLFFGVTAGNMDSMVNRYTADRRVRRNDAYTPGGEGGRRPDRAVIVYAQRCREAFADVPIVIGGIEASLRRIAHYDYWSDKVRRSVLLDAKADLLVYGNAERAIVEIAHRLAAGEPVTALTDIRGTAFVSRSLPDGWVRDRLQRDRRPGACRSPPGPLRHGRPVKARRCAPTGGRRPKAAQVVRFQPRVIKHDRAATVVRLPAYETVPGRSGALRPRLAGPAPGDQPGQRPRPGAAPRRPRRVAQPAADAADHPGDGRRLRAALPRGCRTPRYGDASIPAYEMIRFSVNIMRGCFGGCTFCSITEHEGRIIQSRSEDSILREIETIRDTVPGFTGVISDLGGPTANMYRLACKSKAIEAACRRPSCVYPDICSNLNTDHAPLISLYRRARVLPGIKKVLVASGLRYDLAVKSPEYVKELVTHHVGGYLKIAPEHTEAGPLSKMMKPGMGAYDRFKELFDKYSKEAGKEQYLIPYFIAAHPGTTDEDMLQLALWLKRNGFRADQVQTFLPSPMAMATAMYHSGNNPLRKVTRTSEQVAIPKGLKVRRLHKAFLRYHDPENWPLLRDALQAHGPRRPHRQRQAPPGPGLAAQGDGGESGRQAPAGAPEKGEFPYPALTLRRHSPGGASAAQTGYSAQAGGFAAGAGVAR